MLTPPIFSRSPRLTPALPQGEVELAAPPAKPAKPRSLWPVLIPPLLIAGTMLLIAWATGRISYMAFSAPLILVSGVAAAAAAIQQQREYRQELRNREEGYRDLLLAHEQQFQADRAEQLKLLEQKDPEPRRCLEWAVDLHRNLWTRTPTDDDFLEIRLGLGDRPSSVTIIPPRSDHPFAPDPLITAAQELAGRFADVPNAPISLKLKEAGVTGLVGDRPTILHMMQAIVMQVTAHHSPDEVKLVVIYPHHEESEWAWLRWLPHVWDDEHKRRFLANDAETAHQLLYYLNDALSRRKHQAEAKQSSYTPQFVFLLAAPELVLNEPVIMRLQTEGPELGVYSIFLRERAKELPQKCQAIIQMTAEGAYLSFTRPAIVSYAFTPDQTSRKMVNIFASAIAPIRLHRPPSMADMPTSISFLDMFGVKTVDDLEVGKRWHINQAKLYGNIDKTDRPLMAVLNEDRLLDRELEKVDRLSLAVPIGLRAGNVKVKLDLHERAHGPNGLVAGMVGAGKSELLQTLVASLAVHFHPHQLAFVLIDYKGDATTRPFVDLPHTVGIINNLQEGAMIQRALNSLDVEVDRRRHEFSKIGVNHIDEYQKLYYQGKEVDGHKLKPMPYLVIIVDEFAELKSERPEEATRFISIARVGRSLGLRMILAMQKPAGIVNEQIEANTRFRLCLRVAQIEDSQAMLKRDEAARVTGTGRAYLQVGMNEVFELFQVAYSGAPYDPYGLEADDPHEIAEVMLDGTRDPLYRPGKQGMAVNNTKEEKQLEVLVKYLHELAEAEKIKPLERLWLDPLPEQITLADPRHQPALAWNGYEWVSDQPWLNPVMGLLDDPDNKRQLPLRLQLGQEGHLAIYGAPGSGKTTLIETLIMSIALTYSPLDVHLYLMDFAGQLLKMFEPLPHVGGVVAGDDAERVNRLLGYLRAQIAERKKLFGQIGVNTLPAYRETGQHLPALVVILDNYANFVSSYENYQDTVLQLAREGGNLGIHLILSANGASDIRFKISNNINMAVALQLRDRSEYTETVGRTALLPEPKSGRGLIRQKGQPVLQFQTALPAIGTSDAERTEAMNTIIAQFKNWSGEKATSIPFLSDVIPLTELIEIESGREKTNGQMIDRLMVPLGKQVADLATFSINLNEGPNFLITGGPQSGKTSLLQTWVLALAERCSPSDLCFYLLDSQKLGLSSLAQLPHVAEKYSYIPEQTEELLGIVRQTLQQRRQKLQEHRRQIGPKAGQVLFSPAIVVVVDDAFDHFNTSLSSNKSRDDLAVIINQGRGVGIYLLVASNQSDLSGFNEPVKTLKAAQTGFLLGTGDSAIFNLGLSPAERNKPLPLGEGYWARPGKSIRIKFAIAQEEQRSLETWVEMLIQRYQLSVPLSVEL